MSQLSFIDDDNIDDSVKSKKPTYFCKTHKWATFRDVMDYPINKKGDTKKLCVWCIRHLEELKKQKISFWHKEKEDISDLYVKTILRSGKVQLKGEIPQILIEAKRATIKLNRKIKELKKPIKVCQKHGDLFKDDVVKSGKLKSGNQNYKCKKCMKDMHKRHYEMNKLKVRLKHKIYREENKEKVRESKLRSKQKMLNKYLEMIDMRKLAKSKGVKNGKDKND